MKNDCHPELRQGEFFLTNCRPSEVRDLPWQTKRVGIRAYDDDGHKMSGMVPVFASIAEREVRARHVDIPVYHSR